MKITLLSVCPCNTAPMWSVSYDRNGVVVRVPGYTSRGLGFDSRRYKIFWEVVGLERGPLSLVSTIEELLGRTTSGSGLENRENGRGDPLRWPHDTLYPQKLSLTSPTSGGRSVGIVLLRAKATEFFSSSQNFLLLLLYHSAYQKHDYPEEDSNKKKHHCIILSEIFSHEMRQSNWRSRLENETSAVCVVLKTTRQQRAEETCKNVQQQISH
jgi:hypothetical protein